MIAEQLERALTRIEKGDLADARVALVDAWRAAPQERLARLVELVDARTAAVHEAASAVRDAAAMRARKVLEAFPPDPAITQAVLDIITQPPWRSNPALPFFRAACDRLVMTRDARVLARVESIRLTYPATLPTTVGEKVAGYLDGAIARLQEALAQLPPLDARSADACVAIEKALGAKPPAKTTSGSALASELLRAVYDAPHDDGPRLVLADHLALRGDPRGELINLQLARAAGRADDTSRARELELLAASNGQWTGRAGIAFDEHAFARGFVAYAAIPRTRTVLPTVVDDLSWNTIEILDVRMSSVVTTGVDALAKLIDHAKGLRALLGVPAYILDGRALERIERLEGIAIPVRRDRDVVIRWLAEARAPKQLGLVATAFYDRKTGNDKHVLEPKHVAPIVESPGFARLDTLVLESPGHLDRWLKLFEPMPLRRIVFGLRVGVRVEVTRIGGKFARAVFWRVGDGMNTLPHDSFVSATRSLGRPLELVIDTRTPFLPGLRRAFAIPEAATRATRLTGVVDDLEYC